MKSSTFVKSVAAVALSLSATCVFAQYYDSGVVRNVRPNIVTTQQPVQDCGNSNTYDSGYNQPTERGVGGSIVGGIAGALLGNQIGNGNGRVAATAVGALVGGLTGDRIENRPTNSYQGSSPQCRTVYQSVSRQNGYRVTYEYQGISYDTDSSTQPGRYIPVKLTATPTEW